MRKSNMSTVVPCPSCGTKNRVPAIAAGRPRCASCHADLPWLVDGDAANLDALVDGATPVLVDLWAPWCGPCRTMGPELERLARHRAGRVKVVKVNVDENPSVSDRYQVQGIPTLLLFRNGRLVDRHVGAAPAAVLDRWLDGATA